MGPIEARLLNQFKEKGWTLAFAESCTGGDLAARLTKIPGASDVLLGSLVTYHSGWKENFLKIPPSLITSRGIVSEEVALAMVEGLLGVSEAIIGVAVTGYVKPEGGTIWIAIQKRGQPSQATSLFLKGDRKETIHAIGNNIFNILLSL